MKPKLWSLGPATLLLRSVDPVAKMLVYSHPDGWTIVAGRRGPGPLPFRAQIKRCLMGRACISERCAGHADRVLQLAREIRETYE